MKSETYLCKCYFASVCDHGKRRHGLFLDIPPHLCNKQLDYNTTQTRQTIPTDRFHCSLARWVEKFQQALHNGIEIRQECVAFHALTKVDERRRRVRVYTVVSTTSFMKGIRVNDTTHRGSGASSAGIKTPNSWVWYFSCMTSCWSE